MRHVPFAGVIFIVFLTLSNSEVSLYMSFTFRDPEVSFYDVFLSSWNSEVSFYVVFMTWSLFGCHFHNVFDTFQIRGVILLCFSIILKSNSFI